MYNGKLRKGIILNLSFWFVLFSSGIVAKNIEYFTIVILHAIANMAIYLFISFDALRSAIKLNAYQLHKYNNVFIYLIIIIIQNLAFSLPGINNNITPYTTYRMRSNSMQPTLLYGDWVLVRNIYPKDDFKRNDLIVFKYPMDTSKSFISRIVGLPGDEIEIRHYDVFINKKLVEPIQNNQSDISTNITQPNRYGPSVLRNNSFFLLGDNRRESYDSRFWGSLDISLIRGKAKYIYWSKHFDRIGIELK